MAAGCAFAAQAGDTEGSLTAEFQEDWADYSGASDNAISAGSHWDLLGGAGNQPATSGIIANPGTLGFPASMAKIFKCELSPMNSGFLMPRHTGMSVPSIPFQRYYRWYYRQVGRVILTEGNGQQHPIQDGNSYSDVNWALNVNQPYIDGVATTTTWRPLFSAGVERWGPLTATFDCDHTYRFELLIDALDVSFYRLFVRVYNESGTLILDNSGCFKSISGSDALGTTTNQVWTDVDNMNGLNCGCNGVHDMVNAGTSSTPTVIHSYQGGFAAVDDQDWIGAYGSVIGEDN